jgi:hypothetical protein
MVIDARTECVSDLDYLLMIFAKDDGTATGG